MDFDTSQPDVTYDRTSLQDDFSFLRLKQSTQQHSTEGRDVSESDFAQISNNA